MRFFAHRENQESVDHFFLDFLAFPGFWGVEFRAFQESRESFQAFHAFLHIGESQESVDQFLPGFSRLLGCRILGFPGKRRILKSQESRESFQACRAFLHIGESQESVNHFFLTFLAFPGFWGVEFRAFQETTQSWKARKAEIIPGFTGKCGKSTHSWLFWRAKKVRAFLESQETPGFPGFSLCAKKRGKLGNFPWNSAEFLAHFCRGSYEPNGKTGTISIAAYELAKNA